MNLTTEYIEWNIVEIGDYVEVLSWEELTSKYKTYQEFGGSIGVRHNDVSFTPQMKEFCGYRFYIESIIYSKCRRIETMRDISGDTWNIFDWMVKKVRR